MRSKAIRLVFEHRKTPLRLPMQFDVSALEAMQQYWGRYRHIVYGGSICHDPGFPSCKPDSSRSVQLLFGGLRWFIGLGPLWRPAGFMVLDRHYIDLSGRHLGDPPRHRNLAPVGSYG